MGASRQAYWWERILGAIPGLTMWCPDGNRHFIWQRACWCCDDGFTIRIRGQWVTLRGVQGVRRPGMNHPRKIKAK